MVLSILHLSDVHLRADTANPILDRVASLTAAALSATRSATHLLIIFTGDIAFSGQAIEYHIAAELLAKVEGLLRKGFGGEFIGTVIIPGNHDCNFEKEGDDRQPLISSVLSRLDNLDLNGKSVERILEVQDAFFTFEANLRSAPVRLGADRLFWIHCYDISNLRVIIRCINTAWLSRKKEIPAQLAFPVQAALKPTESELVITVFHHPYGWLAPDNAKRFRRMVETTSDIVLTGHEHEDDYRFTVNADGATVNYIEGSALQDNSAMTGFNCLTVDLASQKYHISRCRWSGDLYVPHSSESLLFVRNRLLLEHQFINNEHFVRELNELEAPFTHPRKATLTLEDLFIYPDIDTLKLENKQASTIRGVEIVDYLVKNKLVEISGAATAGKTSLAKRIYLDMQGRKFVPLLIRGSEIRGFRPKQIEMVIDRAVEHQYSEKLTHRFKQLEPELKVLLIDDWHTIRLNSNGRKAVLNILESLFSRIVLFIDDAAGFEEVSDAQATEFVKKVHRCHIRECGYRLRGELISRWQTLGREFEIGEVEQAEAIAASENLLDTLIERSIIPSFPFFICSVLQISESELSQMVPYGSYGYIYQALLTSRLVRVDKSRVGLMHTYLTSLAHYLLSSDKQAINLSELSVLHREYETEYMITLDRDRILRDLIKSQIIIKVDDNIRFQYKYAYYFFAAKYIQEGISSLRESEDLRGKLFSIADTVHDEHNTNILIFYLYLTKDRVLIEHIIENARKTFVDEPMCDLESDVAFLDKVIPEKDVIVSSSSDTPKNRDRYLRAKDAVIEEVETLIAEATEKEEELQELISEDEKTIKEARMQAREMQFTFRNLQIMGQVLRNFPSDLRADLKLQLATESYRLAFRTIHKFLAAINTCGPDVKELLEKLMREEQAKRSIERDDPDSSEVLSAMTQFIIYGILKKVAFLVGSRELRDIYQKLRESAGEEDLSTRLLDLCIRLDCFGKIPVEDVVDLARRLRNNFIMYGVLRGLIAEYLYLFPCDFRVRQQMMNLFKFTLSPAGPEKKIKQLSARAGA